MRNPSEFIQRQLDYIFIPNSVQESVQNIDVSPAFCSDHSSLLLSYKKNLFIKLGNKLLKI